MHQNPIWTHFQVIPCQKFYTFEQALDRIHAQCLLAHYVQSLCTSSCLQYHHWPISATQLKIRWPMQSTPPNSTSKNHPCQKISLTTYHTEGWGILSYVNLAGCSTRFFVSTFNLGGPRFCGWLDWKSRTIHLQDVLHVNIFPERNTWVMTHTL